MSRHLRVLYVHPAKMRGVGLDLVVAQQLQALVEAGYRVDFLSRGRFAHPNVRNFTLPLTPANLFSSFPAKYYYNLQNRFFSMIGSWLLSRERHDMVISWPRSSLRIVRKATRCGVYSILNSGGWHYNFPVGSTSLKLPAWPQFKPREFDEEYQEYQLANTILVASDFARETFLRNQLNPDKVVAIGRGADIARFRPAERTDGVFRAAFCGRLNGRKGILQLLEAWKLAVLPNAELWLIGDVPNEMESELAGWRGGNCKFFGFRKDPETLLRQCDVQVLLTEKEGMPKALIEGAACGLITITTAEAGFPVTPGDTGYLVRRDQPDEVATILRTLAGDPALRRKMSAASRRFIEQHLTWGAFRHRFLQTIKGRFKAASIQPSATETLR